MKARLNLVVTCAERKVSDPQTKMMLGDVNAGTVLQRSGRWIERLTKETTNRIPAHDLYRGNHWHVVKSIVENAPSNVKLSIWIASAGYGLIRYDAPICAYSATFAPGFDDSVGNAHETEEWWEALARWKGPSKRGPRSLTQLATMDDKTPLLVVASATYVRAMASDIASAGDVLSPRLLGIISAGRHAKGDLASFMIWTDARFQQLVGGQMQALNVRIARRALAGNTNWLKDINLLRTRISQDSKTLKPLKARGGSRLTDKKVTAFIRRERRSDPNTGYTVLLGRLRREGLACEQSRFKKLCKSVDRAQRR